jgi:hypothetical protein
LLKSLPQSPKSVESWPTTAYYTSKVEETGLDGMSEPIALFSCELLAIPDIDVGGINVYNRPSFLQSPIACSVITPGDPCLLPEPVFVNVYGAQKSIRQAGNLFLGSLKFTNTRSSLPLAVWAYLLFVINDDICYFSDVRTDQARRAVGGEPRGQPCLRK